MKTPRQLRTAARCVLGAPMLEDIPQYCLGVVAWAEFHYPDDPEKCLHVGFAIIERINFDEPAIWGPCEVMADDPLDAGAVAQGVVKWDGCCDWSTDDAVMMHFCGPGECLAFGYALEAAYRLAHGLLTSADFEGPEPPPDEDEDEDPA